MKIVYLGVTLGMLAACQSTSNIVPASVAPPPGPTTTTTTSTPTSSPSVSSTSTPDSVDRVAFAGLLNDSRLANGAGAVSFDARLANAAQGHADDMLANNFMGHTGSDGSSAGDRITAAGYNWRTYGENVARGQESEEEVMTAWTNSPGHHANNVNPNFEDFGIAKAGSGNSTRWVLLLGSEF
ncbi:CAP domain-containing protein [Cognatishimia sp. SS12]|uniref:CAP domain-containing protein n=1 Tax=Cognatishimia sp. SS12 TaxID=2979465 RepID=UPI00232BB3B2|nr:CAP domain-containing protein [Cognatishimia sp. SS12]MDC0737957.1 CAP domain-containing protein [Cognatishimia sp. SS12]